MTSSQVIVAGFLLLIVGLVGVWWPCAGAQRRFADRARRHRRRARRRRPPDRRPVAADATCCSATASPGLALALRSSTRAVPMLDARARRSAPAALVDALGRRALVGRRAGWPCRGGRSPPSVASWRSPTSPCSPGTASSTRPSTATSSRRPAWIDAAAAPRRRRRRRPRAAAAGRRVRGLPLGLHRRPAAARADRPPARHAGTCCRSAAPAAMDLLYALDDRFQAGVAETGVDRPGRPAARRRHDLGGRRRGVRPLPHRPRPRSSQRRCSPRPPRRPGVGDAGAVRRRRSSTRPTSRWSTSSRCPTPRVGQPVAARRAGAGATTPVPSSGPRTTSCCRRQRRRRWSTPPRPACSTAAS